MRVFPLIAMVGSLFFTGCAVGPDFQKPGPGAPSAFKFAPIASNATPSVVASLAIESWWQVFSDDRLNQLEMSALKRSPQMAAALARVNEARAQLGVARADELPSLSGAPQIQNAGQSPTQFITINGQTFGYRPQIEKYNIPFTASYELDLWGRVRRSIESSKASFAASGADQRGVLLTLTTDVARYYFSLRELDVEIKVVADTAHSRRETVEVQMSRYRGGFVNNLDVQRSRVAAANAEGDLADLRRSREQTANALAVTTGVAPSEFTAAIDATALILPPAIPAGLPSQLLARRPDLVAAGATLHARTADIGVAQANRLPVISLTGNAGFVSTDLGTLLNPASQFWNIGPSITVPLFTGGRLRSKSEQARANAAEALANYRQNALVAFREVDDALVALIGQSAQGKALDEAEVAASAVSEIAQERYEQGLANYLDVTDAENSLLQIQRSQAQLAGARYASTVSLIKALGGAWGG